MVQYEQAANECIKKLFNTVGENYPKPELTKYKYWYTMRTWTSKEEKDFRDWMRKLLKKRYRWMDKRKLDWEVGMFILNYGWKVRENGTN